LTLDVNEFAGKEWEIPTLCVYVYLELL